MRRRAPLLLALCALACGKSGPGPLASIAVQADGGAPLLLTALGASLQLEAIGADAAGSPVGASALWASSDPSVATVTASGLVRAVGNGSSTITAAAGAVVGSALVHVAQAADTVALLPASAQLERGATVAFSASAVDQQGHAIAGAAIAWAVEDAAIASIDASGVATGLHVGATTVTATIAGKQGSANLSVLVPAASAVSVGADGSGPIASLDGTRQLSAAATDARGSPLPEATFSWTTSDATRVAIDASGLATAKANGDAVITATAGSAQGSLSITVAQAVQSVSVSPAAVTLPPDGVQLFSAAAFDGNGHPVLGALPAAVWASDSAAASIDASGSAHADPEALAQESANITASISGVLSTPAVLTVDPAQAPIASVVASGGGVTLASLGDQAQLSARALNAAGNPVPGATLDWSSSNPGAATVDGSGLVRAVGNGIAVLTASAGGKSDTATITVEQALAQVAVSGPASLALSSIGDALQLSAAAADARGNPIAGAVFSWSSDNGAAAAVSSAGLVTAIGNGSANITARSGAKSDAALVTVQQQVAAVAVSPSQDTQPPDSSADFSAAASDARGHPVAGTASWASDSALVVIDSSGHAAIGATSALAVVHLTATIAGVDGSAELTVDPAAAPVDHLLVSGGGVTLDALDETHQLSAQAFDAADQPLARTISWSSDHPEFVAVDSQGLVTAKGSGAATIAAAAGGKRATTTIAVQQVATSVRVATHASGASTTLASLQQTLQLDAVALDANLHPIAGAPIAWASDSAAVAVDASSGLVTAVANGRADITASDGAVASANFAIAVAQVVASVGVSAGSASSTLTSLGDSLPLTASALDALGSAVATSFTWRASGAAVTVDSASGVVTAAAPGSANLFARAPNAVENAVGFAVAVAQAPASVSVATHAPGASTVLTSIEQTLQLDAAAADANGHAIAGQPFAWRSDDPSVTVDSSGLAKAAANGSAHLFAKAGSLESSGFAVSVAQAASQVAVSGAPPTLVSFGDTVQLSAAGLDAHGHAVAGTTFAWSSSTGAVQVSGAGLVTAVANGAANIVATSQGSVASAPFAITVQQAVSAIAVSGAPTTLTSVNQTVQLSAAATDASGHPITSPAPAFSWSPASGAAATVSSSGLVTARFNGSNNIVVSAGGQSGALSITVQQAVASVAVSPSSASIAKGAAQQFTAVAKDANGVAVSGAPAASWQSSDTGTATIDGSGLASGVNAGGPIDITGTIGGFSGTAQLTVTAGAFALTVNNVDSWCDITATVGAATVLTITTEGSKAISPPQPSGATVSLKATPHPGFTTAHWQGTSSASGNNATYVMTNGASQSVSACCPFSNGTGCPF